MSATAPEVIFTTVHGSHLYGLAGPHSDRDTYTVTTSSRGARQTVRDGDDSVRIGWDAFLTFAFSGSPQSVEALFSTRKEWNPAFAHLQPMLGSYRVTGRLVFERYERTIEKFARAQDFKSQRHAVRLWLNLQELRWFGRFDPTLTPEQAAWATELATADLGRGDLRALLCEGTGALGDFLRDDEVMVPPDHRA